MTGALIILMVTIAVGLMLWVGDRNFRHKHGVRKDRGSDSSGDASDSAGADQHEAPESHGEICCGRHLVCEKSLTPEPGEKILYYDDEELDRFSGREPDDYADEEIDEFRGIMQTMQQKELPGWARSLQLRGIAFPLLLRDELFLLLEDS